MIPVGSYHFPIVSYLSFLGSGFLAQEGGNPFGLLILLLPVAAIIYLTVIPQRKQRKKQAELAANLSVGDEVVTIGGMIGTINFMEGDEVHLEVDDDVVIRFSKSALSGKTTPEGGDPKSSGAKSGWSSLFGGGAKSDES